MDSATAASTVFVPPAASRPWRLDSLVGHDRIRYYSLARWALRESLRLAGAGPGCPVLFPEYICREVLASAAEIGSEPLFYPVDRRLVLAVAPSALPKACAIVAVDFFGFPQELAPFEEYSRRTGALLIEDAAHALFSRDGAGRLLGTRTQLGVFSLRKSVCLPDGGALAVNDPSLAGAVGPQAAFERHGGGRRSLVRPLARRVGGRNMLRLIGLARGLRRLVYGSEIPPARPDCERRIPGPEGPCSQLSRPISAADPSLEVQRRRSLYSRCEGLLSPLGAEPVFDRLPEGTAPYVFPYRALPADAKRIEDALRDAGLFSLPWPDVPAAVAGRAPSHYTDVRGVHFLW